MNAKHVLWIAPLALVLALAAAIAAYALATGAGSAGTPAGYEDSRLLFDPSDPALPEFYAVNGRSSAQCILTSSGVLASCLPQSGSLPGTVTVADDSEADALPAFAYGLARPSVRSVAVVVNGAPHDAMLEGGFYLFTLPTATATVSNVDAVIFTLQDGRTVVRRIHP